MKPFLQGRKTAESKSLPVPVVPPVLPSRDHPVATAKHSVGPNVEIVRKGTLITHLIVTCSCGEKVEVECLYPEQESTGGRAVLRWRAVERRAGCRSRSHRSMEGRNSGSGAGFSAAMAGSASFAVTDFAPGNVSR
jgi:hypothetical protein